MRWRRQGTQKSNAARGGSAGAAGEEEILPLHAGEHEHHGGDAGEDEGGAEVGLLDDQEHEDDRDDGGAKEGVLPVVHGVEARGEKPGEKKDEDELGNFRGLEGEEAAKAYPAMGVVGVAEEEDHDQEHGGDGESGVDEAGRLVAAVVHAHEDDHEEDAGERPPGLTADEGVGGVVALLRDDGGGGKDHGEADDYEQQGGEEDPFVDAYRACAMLTTPRTNDLSVGAPDFRLIVSTLMVSRVGCGDWVVRCSPHQGD